MATHRDDTRLERAAALRVRGAGCGASKTEASGGGAAGKGAPPAAQAQAAPSDGAARYTQGAPVFDLLLLCSDEVSYCVACAENECERWTEDRAAAPLPFTPLVR